MTLSRYLIRSEFKLAYTGLYISSDKNDPGALLEYIAVAGLVGLLRQLGDLAEFAAEIFHELHEDVMATAARSHGLMDRIHNLETQFSSVEMSLLSKTDHTEFYYDRGVFWHPKMCMDGNFITRGDVSRFIRDSYEECLVPPPLHLLDKFDIGGAGTCLKRFTDPSFFKAQQTAAVTGKLEAEKDVWKTRKLKKKGSCWKKGDSSKVLTASRSKLHQLLHEDSARNDRKVPARRASFKIMNLDNSRSSKSYMQEFLQTMSPGHSAALETEVGQGLGSVAEDSIYFSSTDPESKPMTTFKNSYDFNNRQGNKHRNGVLRSSSDGITSAVEYETDALADVESEVETENRYWPSQGNDYKLKEEHLYSMSKQGVRDQFLDFQSVDKSHTSDDGSGSYIQETSSSSLHGVSPYDKRSTAMEHGDVEAVPIPSTGTFMDEDSHSDPLVPAFENRSSFGEISDGLNHEMSNAQKTYGSYWADAAASALLGLNLHSVSPLCTKNHDHVVAYPLSGYQDTEDHVRSTNLSRERNHADDRAVKGNSGSKFGYSHSKNWGSGQISISLSDQQEVGSQCSSSISPRYVVDPSSSCEMTKMEEFRRPQDVSFKQYDQDMKPLDYNHGQVSDRLHLETVADSTIPKEASAADSPLFYNSTKKERGKVTVGRPLEFDSGRESEEFIMGSNMSSPSNSSGLKAGLDREVEKPHEAQTGEVSYHTSIQKPDGFPFPDDSTLLAENKVDMHGQHSHLQSEEVKTDSSIIHPWTFLEAVQSDTFAFAEETQHNYSCLPTSEIHIDDIMMDSDHAIELPVPLLGDTAACTKKTIQPKPAADNNFPMRETTQPSVASKYIKPLLEDSVREFNASDVPMHSKDQPSEDLKSHPRGEYEAKSPEEKIIQCVEMHGPHIMNQEMNSSDRKALWSLGLPNHEDEIPVEKPTAMLRRPWNSVTESAGALDRSKWKKITSRNRFETIHVESLDALDKNKSIKVTPRSRPETQNTNGREKILEVIRSKSFNLKPTPAPVPKPIVRAPTMNIKISAILEKANRIRQATAGSDEEDEWSD